MEVIATDVVAESRRRRLSESDSALHRRRLGQVAFDPCLLARWRKQARKLICPHVSGAKSLERKGDWRDLDQQNGQKEVDCGNWPYLIAKRAGSRRA